MSVEEHKSHKKEYFIVFLALAILTIIEIVIPDLDISKFAKGSSLTFLALGKAFLVAYFYMHLKEETKWLKFIGVIPVSLCDPDELESTVKSNDGRLINNFATIEEDNGIIIVDGEALNGQQCECSYCRGGGEWFSEDHMAYCDSCGCAVGSSCIEYGDEGEYCSSWCKEEREPEDDEE